MIGRSGLQPRPFPFRGTLTLALNISKNTRKIEKEKIYIILGQKIQKNFRVRGDLCSKNFDLQQNYYSVFRLLVFHTYARFYCIDQICCFVYVSKLQWRPNPLKRI